MGDYPSPEEIRERCQEIQSRWSESERRRREQGKYGDERADEHWRPPVILLAELRLESKSVMGG